VPPAPPSRWGRTASAKELIGGAWEKSVTGTSFSAAAMKSCQLRAGIVPPKTRPTPLMFVRGLLWLSEYPIHTAVASVGVYPSNQALV
jgi:hypothetical protein